jgi:hypothetical protein
LATVDAVSQFLNLWGMQLGIVASMIAIGYAGYQVGRHLTNNKWEKRQDQSNKEWEKKLEQE